MTFKKQTYLTSLLSSVVVLSAVLAVVASAQTTASPTVTVTARNSSNQVLDSALVGEKIHALVVVDAPLASTRPEGELIISLYRNLSCSGNPEVKEERTLVNGSASSDAVLLTSSGLSYQARYSGKEGVYGPVTSSCVDVTKASFSPAISLDLSDAEIEVGESVHAIPELSGASADASGLLTYTVYENATCTEVAVTAGQKSFDDGDLKNSDSKQFNEEGTYYWRVVYSGDDHNQAAVSTCTGATLEVGDGEDEEHSAPADGTISGTVYHDENRNHELDNDEDGIAGLRVWLHQKPGNSAGNGNGNRGRGSYNWPVVATEVTDANGRYEFTDLEAGTYFVEQEEPRQWDQRVTDQTVSLADDEDSAEDVNFPNIQAAGGDNGHGHDYSHYGNDNDDERVVRQIDKKVRKVLTSNNSLRNFLSRTR